MCEPPYRLKLVFLLANIWEGIQRWLRRGTRGRGAIYEDILYAVDRCSLTCIIYHILPTVSSGFPRPCIVNKEVNKLRRCKAMQFRAKSRSICWAIHQTPVLLTFVFHSTSLSFHLLL